MKIISKKQRLEKEAKNLVLCTIPNKHKHCLEKCFHGNPHQKEREKDACHLNKELCTIKGIYKVICKRLTKKQQLEWIKKEMEV